MSANQTTKLRIITKYHPDNVCDPVIPTKAYPTDIGYDLTLVRQNKQLNSHTWMYDTSVAVIPPIGYYVEIVPRSSLSKYGYIMANSIGIIDPSYQGTLKIVLTKVVEDAEDITLPFCRFQMILRKAESADLEIIKDHLSETDRGNGGFGSTD